MRKVGITGKEIVGLQFCEDVSCSKVTVHPSPLCYVMERHWYGAVEMDRTRPSMNSQNSILVRKNNCWGNLDSADFCGSIRLC